MTSTNSRLEPTTRLIWIHSQPQRELTTRRTRESLIICFIVSPIKPTDCLTASPCISFATFQFSLGIEITDSLHPLEIPQEKRTFVHHDVAHQYSTSSTLRRIAHRHRVAGPSATPAMLGLSPLPSGHGTTVVQQQQQHSGRPQEHAE